VCHLRRAVLEAFRHDHLDAVLRPGDRVADRLDLGLKHTRDRHTGDPSLHVEAELDRREHRVEDPGDDHAHDVKQRALGRVLP
jgi:hypothetical protein